MDLIEQRPRSVFNTKPVKSNIPIELFEIGKRLSGPREMVKLLRMYIDYGEEMLLTAISRIKTPEITVEQIHAHLTPVDTPLKIPTKIDIKVSQPQFEKYNALIDRGAAL